MLPSSGVGDRYVAFGDLVYYTGRAEPCGERLAEEQPQLRSLNLETGEVSVVADFAFGPAVSEDGRLAFAQGPQQKFGLNTYSSWFTSVVVVTNEVQETWTDPAQTQGRYQPLAWSGATLLAAFEVAETGFLELRALRGPNDEVAIDALLHAVSPDGKYFLVTEGPFGRFLTLYSSELREPVANITYDEWLAVMVPDLDPADDAYDVGGYFDPPAEGMLSSHFGDIWLPDGTIVMNADTGLAIVHVTNGPTPRLEPIKRIDLDPSAGPQQFSLVNQIAVMSDGNIAVIGESHSLPGPPPTLPATASPEEIAALLQNNVPTVTRQALICNIETSSCTNGQVTTIFDSLEWGLK